MDTSDEKKQLANLMKALGIKEGASLHEVNEVITMLSNMQKRYVICLKDGCIFIVYRFSRDFLKEVETHAVGKLLLLDYRISNILQYLIE